MNVLGIVVPLKPEVRSLTSQPLTPSGLVKLSEGTLIKVAGIGSEPAQTAAELLIAEGASALLSWGTAGALHPNLSPGDLMLPRKVLTAQKGVFPTDAAWHNRLFSELSNHLVIHTEPLVESHTVLMSPGEKVSFSKQNNAIAVDMESGTVAEVATRENMPFMAIRAIADPLDLKIPVSVLNAIDELGRLRLLHLLGSLARNPAELFCLGRLGRTFFAARKTLATVARLAGSHFLAP